MSAQVDGIRLSMLLSNPVHNGEVTSHRVKDLPGYTTPIFKGKEEQYASVELEVFNKALSFFRNR